MESCLVLFHSLIIRLLLYRWLLQNIFKQTRSFLYDTSLCPSAMPLVLITLIELDRTAPSGESAFVRVGIDSLFYPILPSPPTTFSSLLLEAWFNMDSELYSVVHHTTSTRLCIPPETSRGDPVDRRLFWLVLKHWWWWWSLVSCFWF